MLHIKLSLLFQILTCQHAIIISVLYAQLRQLSISIIDKNLIFNMRIKFCKKYHFLGIYEPKETLNDSTFHYYIQPQPGFIPVSLHRKSAKKPLVMYYEQIDEQDQNLHKQLSHTLDTSPLIDLDYFNTKNNISHESVEIDRTRITRESQWVKKYEPHKFIELLTDDKINRNLLTWLKAWDFIVFHKHANKKNSITPLMFNKRFNSNHLKPQTENNYFDAVFNNPRKLMLLAGPPGCGKTTLIRVLAQHCKYNIVEINASDDRSANHLITKIEDITNNDTIQGNKQPALICLDEIDGVCDGEANGIVKILDYIENGKKPKQEQNINKNNGEAVENKQKSTIVQSKQFKNKNDKSNQFKDKSNMNNNQLNRPIIFICNDPFAKSLKQLRNKTHVIYFPEMSMERVIERMKQILQKQKIYIEMQVLQKICQICKNDIRGCIGVLELVARQKKINNKNPKGNFAIQVDIINKMRFSFTRDNQLSINEFLLDLFTKQTQKKYEQYHHSSSSMNFVKYVEKQVMEIGNPSMMMENFLQNILYIQGITRKGQPFINLYNELSKSDVLIKNGFKYNNQLQNYHVLPYLNFSLHFGSQEVRKIEFPHVFFQKLKKYVHLHGFQKWNKQILKLIHHNIPIQLKVTITKEAMIGCYLLALYLGMQSSSPKQSAIIRCVSLMLTYGFTLKKERQYQNNSIFSPEVDALLTMGSKKPQVLISNHIKVLMEQNYQFFKQRKQMLTDNQLKNNTSKMINEIHFSSRKKRIHDIGQGIKYKFVQGTGTKTSHFLTINYFF